MQKNQTLSRIEDGGGADRIGEEEEVLGSGYIRAENTCDLDGSDDGTLQDGGADWIRVIDDGGTDWNDVDDSDIDLDGDEEQLQIDGGAVETLEWGCILEWL
jgi:hypothetical protein